MNTNLYLPLGEALRSWLADYIQECGPRLCSEFFGVNKNDFFSLIVRRISAWNTNSFLIFSVINEVVHAQMVEKNTLEITLNDFFSKGTIITVVDPTNGSGCTIDWEKYLEDENNSEILVAAWGKHESIAKHLVDESGKGVLFRGN